MKIVKLAALLLYAAFGSQAVASQPPKIENFNTKSLFEEIDKWLGNDIVAVSVRAHNDQYGNIDQGKVLELDKQWRAEQEMDKKPLIAATLSSPLSVYLTRMQGQSYGLIVEVFVMDKKGLNVGQSSVTSDFWQGDEAKFQKTYDVGPKAVFIDEPEWDDTLQIWRVQINKSLLDPESNQKIGAATVEVNLTELARRQGFSSQ
nr:hypothetical protein [uncultured Cohaesibacter sp.]